MTLNEGVRQGHRWVSIVFTVGVIANLVALAKTDPAHPEAPPMWVGFLALTSLIAVLMMLGLVGFTLLRPRDLEGDRLVNTTIRR